MTTSRFQLALPLALLAAAALAGCQLGASAPSGAITITVTKRFGAVELPAPRHPTFGGATNALALLERNYRVRPAADGEPVGQIEGFGPSAGGPPARWSLYVDGLPVRRNPATVLLHPGQALWWDLEPDNGVQPSGVVGSFPQPFLAGIEGKRYPVRVECAKVGSAACRVVLSTMERLGVPAGLSSVGPGGETPDTLRLAVGPWSAIRELVAASALEREPRQSGVYARLGASGNLLLTYTAEGRLGRSFGAGAGLIAVVKYPTEEPLWLVTGTDEAGVRRAADALTVSALHNHLAVALSPSGKLVPLPEEPALR